MKANVHFFSQKDSIPKGVDLETLGQRGRQANEFSELVFPILPGFIIDSGVASKLSDQNVVDAVKPHLKKIAGIVEKTYGDPKDPLLLKIVISPNLTISNYPTLHNFGLVRSTVGGFNKNVGENFGTHEVAFLARGMLKIEERIAELEKREEDLAKIRERIVQTSKTLDSDKPGAKAEALMASYEDLIPAGFFSDAWTQLDKYLLVISCLWLWLIPGTVQ